VLSSNDATGLSKGDVIRENTISGCYYGIYVSYEPFLIISNIILNSRYAGIEIATNGCLIQGNTITKSYYIGIDLQGNNNNIISNTITLCPTPIRNLGTGNIIR
jgi:parallel beta-helix repeat protein